MLNKKIVFNFFGKDYNITINPVCSSQPSIMCECEGTIVMGFLSKIKNYKIETTKSIKINYLNKANHGSKSFLSRGKKENRVSDDDILISRLIDRAVRPCLPYLYDKLEINIFLIKNSKKTDTSIISILTSNILLKLSLEKEYNLSLGMKFSLYSNNININRLENGLDNILTCSFSAGIKSINMIELNSIAINVNVFVVYLKGMYEKLKDYVIKLDNILKEILDNSTIVPNKIIEILENNELVEVAYNIIITLAEMVGNEISYSQLIDYYKKEVFENKEIITFINSIEEELKEIYLDYILKNGIQKYYINKSTRVDGRSFKTLRKVTYDYVNGNYIILANKGLTQLLVTLIHSSLQESSYYIKKINVIYSFNNFSQKDYIKLVYTKRREIGHSYLVERAMESILDQNIKKNIKVNIDVFCADGSTSITSAMGSSFLACKNNFSKNNQFLVGLTVGGIYDNNNNIQLLYDITSAEDEYGLLDIKILFNNSKKLILIQMDSKTECVCIEKIEEAIITAQNLVGKYILNTDKLLNNNIDSF